MKTCSFGENLEDKLAAVYIQQKGARFYIYTTVRKGTLQEHYAMDLSKINDYRSS
jgi:hypothetical protein